MELKEQELMDLIKSGESFILKVFMDDCSFCEEYAPIWDAASKKHSNIKFVQFNLPARTGGGSEFKRNYMKANGKERIAAPATFKFEKGEMVARHYGRMYQEQLDAFIKTGEVPQAQPSSQKEAARRELIDLFAKKGEIITFYEQLPALNQRINELQQYLNQG